MRSGDLGELKEFRAKAGELSLIPPVSHSLTTVFLDSVAKSFKFQRMVNSSLMAATVSGRNKINSKAGGKWFCNMLGCLVPKTYITNVSMKELSGFDFGTVRTDFVVKPVFGAQSKNVYGLRLGEDGSVKDVFSRNSYPSMSAFLNYVAEVTPSSVKWEVEELVLNNDDNVSYDVKFYSFYGKVVLVLQVARWGKKREDVFFDRTGKRVDAKVERYFSESGGVFLPLFSEEDISQIEGLSAEIPFPFCRIDFLAGKKGLYFGEFTFNAGGAGGFYDEWDKKLGEEFQLAQNRLMKDLLDSKKFDVYKKLELNKL